MYLVGWKPVSYNFSIPSARIRCLNIIRNFSSDAIALEVFREEQYADRYDAVIFSKNYSPESLGQAAALKKAGKIVIFDIFDNRFFMPEDSEASKESVSRLQKMCAIADGVTTSNDHLKQLLASYIPGREITPIEEALEETLFTAQDSLAKRINARWHFVRYSLRLQGMARDKTRLIWFGTSGDNSRIKSGGMTDLLKLQSLLHRPEFKDNIVLTICSNGEKTYRDVFADWQIPTLFVKWNPLTFYRVLRQNHVALIPVTINPLTLYKSNNRMVTALYNNLAVIADEIPSYKEFEHCVVLNDWEGGFRRFIGQRQHREQCILKGQDIIRKKYLPRLIADQWRDYLVATLNHAAGGKATASLAS